MDIKILGTGCKKCRQLETLTRRVVAGRVPSEQALTALLTNP